MGTVANGTPPTDTDRDGMPDDWEKKHGLNPDNADDRNGKELSADGYTNIEMYINELAGDPVVFAGGTVSTGEMRPFLTNSRDLCRKKETGIIEIYSIQGHLLYKGTHKPELVPSGLSIVVEKNRSGQVLYRSAEHNF